MHNPKHLVGLVGRKRSGKDTAAAIFIHQHGFTDVKMAGGLKAMLVAFYRHLGSEIAQGLVEDEHLKSYQFGQLRVPDMALAANIMAEALLVYMGASEKNAFLVMRDEKFNNTPIQELRGRTPKELQSTLLWWLHAWAGGTNVTSRHLMQTLGTEWGRDKLYADVWIDVFEHRAETSPRVVCSDVRFHNEADRIRKMGGTLIKIDASERLGVNEDTHRSEAEIDEIETDIVIENNGTLEDFLEKVREVQL